MARKPHQSDVISYNRILTAATVQPHNLIVAADLILNNKTFNLKYVTTIPHLNHLLHIHINSIRSIVTNQYD